MTPSKPRLYHLTAAAPSHLGAILREGKIRTTESNITTPFHPDDEPGGDPQVVWLTSDPTMDLAEQPWSYREKLTARIEVAVDNAVQWVEWIKDYPMEVHWQAALVSSGGGIERARNWWIVERPIEVQEFVALRMLTPQGPPLDLDRQDLMAIRDAILAADRTVADARA